MNLDNDPIFNDAPECNECIGDRTDNCKKEGYTKTPYGCFPSGSYRALVANSGIMLNMGGNVLTEEGAKATEDRMYRVKKIGRLRWERMNKHLFEGEGVSNLG